MRRGSFSRHRTPAPNLTGLIASLIREQRAAEDRNMFDAYNNGGLVDGKPVTDERLLKYMAMRRDSISRDDPMWDQWNNQHIQLKFSIGEQKIGLAFKEGKVGAGAVAAFYRQQLEHIPKDSAFYRDVAGRAAQWAKSAAASGRAAASSRASAALNATLAHAQGVINSYGQLTNIIEQAAHRAGLITGNQKLTDANAGDLINLISHLGITVGKHNTPLTYDVWVNSSLHAYNAYTTAITAADKAGRSTKGLRDQRASFLSKTIVPINALDDRAKYEELRATYESDVSKLGNDPYAIYDRTQQYAKDLAGLRDVAGAATGKKANDADFIGGLNNEIEALTTGKASGPTVFDSFEGQQQGTSTTMKDASDTADQVTALMADYNALNSGTAYFGQIKPGDPFTTIFYPPNAATDPFGRKGLPEDKQPSITTINGQPRAVVLAGTPVYAQALVDASGKIVDPHSMSPDALRAALANGSVRPDPKGEQLAGYQFDNPTTGKTSWAVKNADGTLAFTNDNPFSNGLTGGKDGLVTFVNGATGQDPSGNPTIVPDLQTGIVPNFGGGAGTINGANPVNFDANVAPADLLKLADSGQFGDPNSGPIVALRQGLQARIDFRSGITQSGDALLHKDAGHAAPDIGALGQNLLTLATGGNQGEQQALTALGGIAGPFLSQLGGAATMPNLKLPGLPGKAADDAALLKIPKPPAPPKPKVAPKPQPPNQPKAKNNQGGKAQGGADDSLLMKPPPPPPKPSSFKGV